MNRSDSRSRYTGWATGYDLIPVHKYFCPEHGEVNGGEIIGPTYVHGVIQLDPGGHIQWVHQGCGLKVERVDGTLGDCGT